MKEINSNIRDEGQLLPPELWLSSECLQVKIEHFPDTPMHLLFLGVMKHLMQNCVVRLFKGERNRSNSSAQSYRPTSMCSMNYWSAGATLQHFLTTRIFSIWNFLVSHLYILGCLKISRVTLLLLCIIPLGR